MAENFLEDCAKKARKKCRNIGDWGETLYYTLQHFFRNFF